MVALAAFLPGMGGDVEAFALVRHPGRPATDFYEWKYLANPEGKPHVAIATVGGRVVSAAAATPRRFRVHGELWVGYELGDFLTAPDYRRQGLFKRLVRMVIDAGVGSGGRFFYSRPNDQSWPILASLGFREWRRIHERSRVVLGEAVRRRLRLPMRVPLLDAVVDAFQLPARPLALREVAVPEPALAKGCAVSVERSSDYLRWRYAAGPTPFRSFGLDDGARGYVVAQLSEADGIGRVVDLTCAVDDDEAARSLVVGALTWLRSSGARRVYTWTFVEPEVTAATEALASTLPDVEGEALRCVVHAPDARDADLLCVASPVHLTCGDFDGI
jgi:GNAT superfamily N-acetyltransferase